jgi:PEP-CTERM motif
MDMDGQVIVYSHPKTMRFTLYLAVLAVSPVAFAGQSSLNEWCFYINTLDVNHSCAEATPTTFNPPVAGATFAASPGEPDLGTVSIVVGPGNYNVFAFFSYSAGTGGFSQYATTVGTLTAGQVYSVDAPGDPSSGGSVSPYSPGYLQNQYNLGTLDNTNHLGSGACAATNSCEPVSVALGYTNLGVPDGQQELITFTVGDTPPASGFYVTQTNPQTGDSLFFSADPQSLSAVPEPLSMMLLGSGLGLIGWAARRRLK